MKKKEQVYYVINFNSVQVVERIDSVGLGYDVTYKDLITIASFARCGSLKEARETRKELGGVIMKGIE